MRFKEFGDRQNPVVVLIHGGFVSWKMWLPQIDAFSKAYYVVVPVLDGHDETGNTNFHSIEKAADELIRYLEKHFQGNIFALCGVSLGGAIAAHTLLQNRIEVKKVIIDGAPVAKTNKIFSFTMKIFLRRLFKKIRGGDNIYRRTFRFFPEAVADDAFHICRRMSDETVENIHRACYAYSLPGPGALNTNTESAYWYGSKEAFICKRMAKQMSKAVKNTRTESFKGYRHGELCIGNPDLYIKKALEFFEHRHKIRRE
ncbi:Pimeloyl-ACP methyl ester carboxylesterase [Evansella caseinilytica]|uniref:Pimeloyl-ACP methyl ester carboxylesterase n=1 Tax=Evansella caseinilytica TaxID=1503961 RepID=A0A1H3H985_9BACI|nr:alpha/beta hydrolase [Evansella caseinilytica]SDY11987.1 Pimeloyl-ACP methyl ester carboxylesterase [Evansella caseinilytica]